MHLRWTEAAATDLERIADYLFSHAPERAPRPIRSIYEAPEALLSLPHRGRPWKKAEGPNGSPSGGAWANLGPSFRYRGSAWASRPRFMTSASADSAGVSDN